MNLLGGLKHLVTTIGGVCNYSLVKAWKAWIHLSLPHERMVTIESLML